VPLEYMVKNMIPVLGQVCLQVLHLFPVNYHSTKSSLVISIKGKLKKMSTQPPYCYFTFYKNVTSTEAVYFCKVYYHTHTNTPTNACACMKMM
jgi:hypothetical protein